jgi:hypothetical protein
MAWHSGNSSRSDTNSENNFELAPEILRIGMSEQEERSGMGVGNNVERLVATHTRDRTCGDVADRVAARFTRRDPDRSKTPHQIRRVVDVHEV